MQQTRSRIPPWFFGAFFVAQAREDYRKRSLPIHGGSPGCGRSQKKKRLIARRKNIVQG